MKPRIILGTGIMLLWLSACSAPQPILYPNVHYQSVGKVIAERDIRECRELAAAAGAREGGSGTGNVTRRTTIGAGAGAATGAVGGAISGSAARGAMIGAASGATWGLLSGVIGSGGSSQPAPAYTNFVNRCLHERGYEITGWQ